MYIPGIVERMRVLSILFAKCRGMTGSIGWAQVGAGTGMCLPTVRTDSSFDLKPSGFAIASWFREVPAHVALNGCLHWGYKVSFMTLLLRGKGFPPWSWFFWLRELEGWLYLHSALTESNFCSFSFLC